MRHIIALAALLGLLCVASLAWGQVSVPNTFSANTAAKADEVNANFQALVDAINGSGGGSLTAVSSGYSLGYGTSSTAADRNVTVFRRTTTSGSTTYYQYQLFLYYKNGTVKVDGTTDTTYAYVEEYLSFLTDTSGTIASSAIGGSRRGTNDTPGSATTTWYEDSVQYSATNGTVTGNAASTIGRFDDIRVGKPYFNVPQMRYVMSFSTSTSTEPIQILDRMRLFVQRSGSVTINGITYSDILVYLEPGMSRRSILAKGVGLVYWDINSGSSAVTGSDVYKALYTRIDGTEAGATNLSGTPLGTGGVVAGVFF